MSSRTRRAAIDDAEWERVKATVRQLYLVDGKTQKDTLDILREYHDFHPSKSQLERKLKQWRMVRNITGSEWKYVDRMIRQRHSNGKGSQLYLSGIPLRPAAIEKARSRHCYETAIEKSCPMPEPSCPEDLPLIVCTPSPLEQRCSRYLGEIPWLQSLGFLKGFTAMFPHYKRGTYDSLRFLGNELLQFTPKHLQHSPRYTSQLQWTYQALCLIMPGRSLEDHIFKAWDILSLANYNSPEALEIVFFLLSNNFLELFPKKPTSNANQIIDDVFGLLHKSNGWALITSQPYSELPSSLQAILDRLFKESVERFDLKAARYLLEAGVNANSDMLSSRFIREYNVVWRMRPFELAALIYRTDMAELLAKYGANTDLSSLKGVEYVIGSSSRNNATRVTLPWVNFILSHCVYRADCEPYVRRILHSAETCGITTVTEALIEYFRTRVGAAESISQLIVTAIKTESGLLSVLLSQYPDHINATSSYGETPLMAAAEKGNLPVCKQLLRLGASIESQCDRSASFITATPLQCAACFSDARMVRYLLDSGAEIDFYHPKDAMHSRSVGSVVHQIFSVSAGHFLRLQSLGRTALQAALIGGNEDTAKLLLDEGAKLFGSEQAISIRKRLTKLINLNWSRQPSFANETIPSGLLTSSLEAAIIAGDYDLAQHQLITSPSSITPEALYAAIWFTNLKSTSGLAFVRRILEQGAGLRHSTNHWVGTAMSLAAELGSMEVVEFMLNCGLRPKYCLARTREFFSAPVWQQRSVSGASQTEEVYLKWLSTVLTELDDGEGVWPMLDEAGYKGRQDYLDLLLSHGYEPTASCAVRATCGNKLTPILTLQFLNEHGVSMTQYVLSGSILSADLASIEWLLSLGLDLNEEVEPMGQICDGLFERTAVQAAAQRGDIALLDKLVSLGADINAPAYHRRGATALQVAAIQGYFEIVRRLLVLGADPNANGAKLHGRTALEGAAENGRLDVVQLLLNSGVETIGQGRRQFVRAFVFAGIEDHAAVATLLRSHRTWTAADQDILAEGVLPMPGGKQKSQKEADHQSISLDQNVEDGREHEPDAACYDPHQLPVEPIPASTYEASESFGQADCGRSIGFVTQHDDQSHSENGYIKSEMESLGVIHGEAQLAAASGTQESSGEAENDFRPSGIFDQVKEDLNSTGDGDGIWVEAYNAFSLDTIC